MTTATATQAPARLTLAEIKAGYTGHFFNPADMRCFNSRIGTASGRTDPRGFLAGFVTSEKFDGFYEVPAEPRKHTARYRSRGEGYNIYSIGKFQAFKTGAAANAEIARWIAMMDDPRWGELYRADYMEPVAWAELYSVLYSLRDLIVQPVQRLYAGPGALGLYVWSSRRGNPQAIILTAYTHGIHAEPMTNWKRPE